MTTSEPIRVLILTSGGLDTLDFAGPLEIFVNANHYPRGKMSKLFECKIAAGEEMVVTSQGLQVKRDISIQDAMLNLECWDVLVVPGGRPNLILELARPEAEEIRLVQKFAQLSARPGRERIILSVCTGSLLLGAAGLLRGLVATTHHGYLDDLRNACQGQGDTTVVRKRFVDAGLTINGTRIITAGGVLCGIDATLYLVELKYGEQVSSEQAELLDYNYRKSEALIARHVTS